MQVCCMVVMRRTYLLGIFVNGRWFNRVEIDPHYEEKHGETVNDVIILELVKSLSTKKYVAERIDKNDFHYFTTEPIFFEEKPYRLVWLTHPKESFIGVRNAFRRPYE